MTKPRSLLHTFGIHPAAAALLIAVDAMLFTGEAATAGVALAVTVPVGFLMGMTAAILQKKAHQDGWGAAIAKGVVLGVLTAIPTPLPAFVTAMSGLAGFLDRFQSKPKAEAEQE